MISNDGLECRQVWDDYVVTLNESNANEEIVTKEFNIKNENTTQIIAEIKIERRTDDGGTITSENSVLRVIFLKGDSGFTVDTAHIEDITE